MEIGKNTNVGEQRSRVSEIVGTFNALKWKWADFRREVVRNYRYAIGDQIDREVMETLRRDERPVIIFNILHPLLLTIAGHLAGDKTRMKAVPTAQGDELAAEMHSTITSDWAIGDDGYFEIGKAALDAAIAKIGWVQGYWDTRDDIEGRWNCQSVDPLMVMFDADAKRMDQKDWRYMTFTGWYSADEIVQIYPDLDPLLKQKLQEQARILEGTYRRGGMAPVGWYEKVKDFFTGVFTTTKERSLTEDGILTDFADAKNGLYRVIEWHDKRMVRKVWAYSPMTRDMVRIPAEKEQDKEYIDGVLAQMPEGELRQYDVEEIWETTVVPALLPTDCLLERPYKVQGKGFRIKPIYCYDFHPDPTKTQAVFDALIYPQNSVNQRQMSLLEWVLRGVNPDIDAPDGSISPEHEEAWKSRKRGVLRYFKNVNGDKPQRTTPDTNTANILNLLTQDHKDLTRSISGITPNLSGESETSKESGVLFAQRTQAALVNLQYLQKNVMKAMAHIFTYTDAALQQYLTFPRALRLLNDNGDPYWIQVNYPTLQGVLNDYSQGTYDFRVDENAMGITQKRLKFLEWLEMAKTMPQELVPWDQGIMLWDNPAAKKMAQYVKQMMDLKLQGAMQQLNARQMKSELEQAAGAAGIMQQAAEAEGSQIDRAMEMRRQAMDQMRQRNDTTGGQTQ